MASDQLHERSRFVLADRVIVRTPTEPIGPSSLIGALVPRALRAPTLAVAGDPAPASIECAALFARAAIHGGYPADRRSGFQRVTVYTLGHGDTGHLLERARDLGVHAAIFTTADGARTELRLYTPGGAPVTEANGLARLRERLATGRAALPLNNAAVGQIIDRPDPSPRHGAGRAEELTPAVPSPGPAPRPAERHGVLTAPRTTAVEAAYRPGEHPRRGWFLVLEGPCGSGKSTVAALLATRLGALSLHTAPDPLTGLQPYVNTRARPLPHLMFYLAGALHVADLARTALTDGPVIADRYISSVIADHAAIHDVDILDTQAVIAPFRPYLAHPDLSVYLHGDPGELAERTRRRHLLNADTRAPQAGVALIARTQQRFDDVAAKDPTAVHLDTSTSTAHQVADTIWAMITDRAH